ncbi:hypothetical protein K461DRAFT_273005 [Myriangium duriaei CBS 260.36]|uniref:Uncharacterized protein n=1 Tax=Myriangium duriaei CBS 260.36 TaxID=1168546 RepID=A0A9P4MP64_9PEZI|nr:hypothetical protein K461DRAFT_273005 [Myriangium duriaei CBS 260.36]
MLPGTLVLVLVLVLVVLGRLKGRVIWMLLETVVGELVLRTARGTLLAVLVVVPQIEHEIVLGVVVPLMVLEMEHA